MSRIARRTDVMLDLNLSPNARILYYLIDDKSGDSGRMWWHWRKIAVLVGVGHTQFFELIGELRAAGYLGVEHEGRRVVYSISCRESGIVHSGKPERSFRKTGTKPPASIYEPVKESVPLIPFQEEPKTPGECSECFGAGYVLVSRVLRGQSYNERSLCKCSGVRKRA